MCGPKQDKSRPSSDVVRRLADALGTTADFLMNGDSHTVAAAKLVDRDLLDLFAAVEQLDPTDQTMVKTSTPSSPNAASSSWPRWLKPAARVTKPYPRRESCPTAAIRPYRHKEYCHYGALFIGQLVKINTTVYDWLRLQPPDIPISHLPYPDLDMLGYENTIFPEVYLKRPTTLLYMRRN